MALLLLNKMTLGKSLLLPKLVSSFVPKGFLEESMRQHVFSLAGPGAHWKVKWVGAENRDLSPLHA